MKTLTLTFLTLLASTASYAATCTVQGNSVGVSDAKYSTLAQTHYLNLGAQHFIQDLPTWQSCRALAIKKAIEYGKDETFVEYGLSGFYADVYFSWTFEDGSWAGLAGYLNGAQLFNSEGQVTRHTPDFDRKARRGDQRYYSNGSRF